MPKCIGGVADGRVIGTSLERITVPVPPRSRVKFYKDTEPIVRGSIRTDDYVRETIAGEHQTHEIFRHTGISVDTMIKMLIDNYSKGTDQSEVFEESIRKRNLPTDKDAWASTRTA